MRKIDKGEYALGTDQGLTFVRLLLSGGGGYKHEILKEAYFDGQAINSVIEFAPGKLVVLLGTSPQFHFVDRY